MPTQQEIFNKKDKFLEGREAVLNRKVLAAQKKLLDKIVDQFVDQLETSGGLITNNGKNIELTQALDKIFTDFDQTLNKDLVDGYIKDIQAGQTLNKQYFSTFEENSKKFGTAANRVQTTIRNRLGITKNNTIKRNGYLGNFLKNNPGQQDVLEIATKAITGEQSKAAARKQLATSVTGDANVSGKLAGHYRTFINDTYQQIDNLESKEYAGALGMTAAYYLGGTINTTRKFCKQRNGNLYTDEEIASWEDLKWQGKNKNYDPFTDMGGYNCRHRFRYISNKQAARNRKDLTLTADGKLIKTADAPKKPKLNKIPEPKKPVVKRKPAKPKPPSTSDINTARVNQAAWIEKMPESERKAIKRYTQNDGFGMNQQLRFGDAGVNRKYNDLDKANFRKAADEISIGLSKAPKYTGDTYRGLKFKDEAARTDWAKDVKVGQVWSDKAFLSSTHQVDGKVVKNFSARLSNRGVKMKIKSKNGVLINKVSAHPAEQEVLFDRNSSFQVTSKTVTPDGIMEVELTEF